MVWGFLGVPLERLWGGFWVGKFGTKKKRKKTIRWVVASADDADPGKEGFRVAKGQVGKI